MAKSSKARQPYDADHERRIQWWRKARFGMFIHWGAYAVHGRSEWAMNLERIPIPEYEKYADAFKPKPKAPREWARLARDAGMKHMVMTAKHHEGFCLWDSKLTDFNAVQRGPGRDLVAEYLDAAREFGLKAGLYYSLMDWHHPDGARCALDKKAYKRFMDFTQGCVRELMTSYGTIDILWYDLCWPFMTSRQWQSRKLNAMVRKLQPDILINDRSLEPEDFCTESEGHVSPAAAGRDWECCATTTGTWGYNRRGKSIGAKGILKLFRNIAAAGNPGNLLLNIGPKADGSVPDDCARDIRAAGRWLQKYGKDVFYAKTDPMVSRGTMDGDLFTRSGRTGWLWCFGWTGEDKVLGAWRGKIRSARLYPGGKRLRVEQTSDRAILRGLPKKNPEPIAGVPLIKLECAGVPMQESSIGCVILPFERKAAKKGKKK